MRRGTNKNPAGLTAGYAELFFTEQMIADKAYTHTEQIENQIIYIEAAQQREQLQYFHQKHDTQTYAEKTEEIAQLGVDSGNQFADGDKEKDIAAQIDDAVYKRRVVCPVVDHFPVITDSQKGL